MSNRVSSMASVPDSNRIEESVDDVTDYICSYGKKAGHIYFSAFLLSAISASVECFHLYTSQDDPYDRTIYIDSLRLDLLVHTTLALSFFVLFSCIKIIFYVEMSKNSRTVCNLIMWACFIFVAVVFVFVTSWIYLLIDLILSTQDYNVMSSSSTCVGDAINILLCVLMIIVIREKNRVIVMAVVEQSPCLSCFAASLQKWYSNCFDEVKPRAIENCASYGSTDDNFPDVDSTSLLGHSCDFLSVGDRSQSWDGMALGRASISGPEGVVGRVSSAGGRVSNGRRSLSRTSDLAYMVGTRVLATWTVEAGRNRRNVSWYPATIVNVHTDTDERMYDIVYYDGDVAKRKPHNSVHEYDEALDLSNSNIIGKSRRMRILMLLWLSILYSYCFLKFVALASNAITVEFIYLVGPVNDVFIQRFHKAMTCVTIPLVLGSIFLWTTAAGHFIIMLMRIGCGCGCGSTGSVPGSSATVGTGDIKHTELVVQSIECVLKIPLQPKRSAHKPSQTVFA